MGRAVDFRMFSTAAAFKLGFFSSIRAAVAAVCGVAIEVPPTQ